MPSARRLNSQFPWSTFCFEFFLFFSTIFFVVKLSYLISLNLRRCRDTGTRDRCGFKWCIVFFYVYFSLESLSLRSHFVKVYMNNLFPCIISLTTVNSTTCAYYTDFFLFCFLDYSLIINAVWRRNIHRMNGGKTANWTLKISRKTKCCVHQKELRIVCLRTLLSGEYPANFSIRVIVMTI